MRYSLWSHGTLVGYTDLDIECINENLRMGFLEPTEAGMKAILDAVGVHAVCAKRPIRWRDEPDPAYLEEFDAATARREALNLELRDETGALFPCAYMRVYDSFLKWPEETEADRPLDDLDLDPELRAQMEADRAELEQWFKEAEEAEEDAEAEAWKHDDEEDDPRFGTMQYTIQVVLREEPFVKDESW